MSSKTAVKYGNGTVEIEIPEGFRSKIVRPTFEPGTDDPESLLRNALRNPIGAPPLESMATGAKTVGIVFSDITRATPNRLILPALFEALRAAGIQDDSVVLFNATGTHRINTRDELVEILGEETVGRFEIVQNTSSDRSTFVSVGTTSTGNEVLLNRRLCECDLRILTGFIEPHFFAGFSGGGKAIMPGCASIDTILRNHGHRNIDNPKASWGETRVNPIASEVREAVACKLCGTPNPTG